MLLLILRILYGILLEHNLARYGLYHSACCSRRCKTSYRKQVPSLHGNSCSFAPHKLLYRFVYLHFYAVDFYSVPYCSLAKCQRIFQKLGKSCCIFGNRHRIDCIFPVAGIFRTSKHKCFRQCVPVNLCN